MLIASIATAQTYTTTPRWGLEVPTLNSSNWGPPLQSSLNTIDSAGDGNVLAGSGAPSNLIGFNGDYYINSVNLCIYGPKASNVWPGSPFCPIGTAVTSINSQSGAFTFNGGGVSCIGTTCTFSAGDTITSPNSTLTVGGTSSATTLDLNLSHSNTWAAEQQFNVGVYNSGTGLKHVRSSTSCTTTADQWATCTSPTISWPGTAFADTYYTISCSLVSMSNLPALVGITKAVGGFTYTIQTLAAVASSVTEIDCIAIHD
jgi:hypothetical protein